MKLFKMQVLLTLAVLCAAGAAQANWVTLDFPGATSTNAYGLDGGNIVGEYTDASGGQYGFIYDGTTWTTLDYPGADESGVYSIDGGNIVGYYEEDFQNYHGFLYDGTTWIILDFPGATDTYAYGIDDGEIVGDYQDATGGGAFLYDGATWTALDPFGAEHISAHDIDGGNIVGAIPTVYGSMGFLYDGAMWTIPNSNPPPATWDDTVANGIDGDIIVGEWWGSGLIYNGGDFFSISQGRSGHLYSELIVMTLLGIIGTVSLGAAFFTQSPNRPRFYSALAV